MKKEFETQVRDVIKALIRLGSESGTQVRDLNNSGSECFGLCEKIEPFMGKNYWQEI